MSDRYPQLLNELPIRFPWSRYLCPDEFEDFAADLSTTEPEGSELWNACVNQYRKLAGVFHD